jgi:FemAB-related protein (PEP-CTERM system-associated)
MTVEVVQPQTNDSWDEFVRQHPHGTPFHLLAWRRAIEATFGFRPLYLAARGSGSLKGVLPLFETWNPLQGRVLLSTPFAVYGGILAEDPETARTLQAAAERLGRERRVQYIELRNHNDAQRGEWPVVRRYATFRQPIASTEEGILAALPRETRRMTRRALEHAYESRRTRDFSRFLPLYLANLRRLGTPAFPRKHFANLMAQFPDADVLEVLLEGKVVAAVLNLYFRDEILPYYGASDPAYNRANPNNLMYYRLLCESAERGLRIFDFGRSRKGSGSHAFKSHWGMEESDLPYEVLLVRRRELPNFSPTNVRYGTAIRLWQKLPLSVVNRLGPLFIRLVP